MLVVFEVVVYVAAMLKSILTAAIVVMIGCNSSSGTQGRESPARADTEERGKAGPLAVIGLDAASYAIMDPLVAEGDLPTLAKLMKRGSRAVLESEKPIRSPALWTTIATGQPRSVHRIYDFVTGSNYWPPAERHHHGHLVTSDMRRSKALWQYASEAGKRVLVVGWLNSWPAERVNGVMIAPYVALGQRKQTSIKGKIYRDEKQQSYPREVFQEILPRVVAPGDISDELLGSIVDLPGDDSPLYGQVPKLRRYLYTVRWSLASALTNFAIIEDRLKKNGPFDLVMTFFDGTDTLAHRFWLFRQPLAEIRERLVAHAIDPNLADELKARFGEALDNYYRFIDGKLARLLAALPENTTTVVLSDHGFGTYPNARAIHSSTPFDGMHTLDGVFIASGATARSGHRVSQKMNQYDVLPTLLFRLDLSVPRALPGEAELGVFSPEFLEHHKLRLDDASTDNGFTGEHDEESETPFEEEELERLRSLGYVQ